MSAWWLLLGLPGVFLAIMLAGMCAALLEIAREKRAGVPVTRPAWDARRARRERGGTRAAARGVWKGLRS